MKKKNLYLLLALFTVFFIWVFSFTVNPKLDLNGDNASYIGLAHRLADGKGYTNVLIDGTLSPASHFPPGYPFVLSLLIRCGIDTLMGFKIFNAVLLYASMLMLGFLIKKITRQNYLAFSAIVLSCLSPVLMHFAGMVMSEITYMTATLLSLFALFMYGNLSEEKLKQRFGFLKSPWFYVAFIAAAASYYVRTVGLSAMFAVVVFFLFRKEWLATAGAVAGMFLCLLPWSLRNAANGIESRYMGTIMTVNPWRPEEGQISSVGEMIKKMIVNIDDTVIKGFPSLLFPFTQYSSEPSGFWGWVIGLLVLAVVVYGAWNMGRLRWALIAFIAGNIGLFALWHGGNGTRYVTPLIPIIFACFLAGIYYLFIWFRQRSANFSGLKDNSLVPALFLLLALPMIKPIQQEHALAKQGYHPAYYNYFSLVTQLNNESQPGTILCCRKPEFLTVFGPRLIGTNYAYSLEPDTVISDLVKKKVDYVILEQLGFSSTFRYLYPAIQKYPQLFTLHKHLPNPDTYLFRFEKEKAQQVLTAKPKNAGQSENGNL